VSRNVIQYQSSDISLMRYKSARAGVNYVYAITRYGTRLVAYELLVIQPSQLVVTLQ
jgi:hypothetical protein